MRSKGYIGIQKMRQTKRRFPADNRQGIKSLTFGEHRGRLGTQLDVDFRLIDSLAKLYERTGFELANAFFGHA